MAFMMIQGLISGRQFCGILLGKGCGNWQEVNAWTLEVPPGKPDPPVLTPPNATAPKTRFLQLSDIHIDQTYTLGSTSVNCGQVMCCTNATNSSTDPDSETKYWGGYHCDTPIWTFEDLLSHISQTHPDIDYIILTGDYPAHDFWLQSRDQNLRVTEMGFNLVQSFFPDLPIYSSVGNHESFPCNSFPTNKSIPDEWNSGWLYPELARLYSNHLDASAQASLAESGFYSMTVMPGFRIIAINSNMCLSYNFWMSYTWIDPLGQLKWLIQELLEAEAVGDKVHIISHVPSGQPECQGAWSREYSRILDRFEATVVNHFYGHTHNDHFFVVYDEETKSRPVSAGFVSPSVTTWSNLNPSYRIYTVDGPYDGASMRVINHETFIFNLTEANEVGSGTRPAYFKLYDAQADLELSSLFPQDLDDLARRLAVDDVVWDRFARYYMSGTEAKELSRRDVVCSLVTSSNLDDSKCIEIMGPDIEYE